MRHRAPLPRPFVREAGGLTPIAIRFETLGLGAGCCCWDMGVGTAGPNGSLPHVRLGAPIVARASAH
eukprot:7232837-Prymnesium_polylepis.1